MNFTSTGVNPINYRNNPPKTVLITRTPHQPNTILTTNSTITKNTNTVQSMQYNMLGRLMNNGKCLGCNNK